jgi:serine/threonine-protein kinase
MRLPVLALLLVSLSSLAHAQNTDRAAADDLFKQGREAMKHGDFATACPKLEASNKLDPAYGTLRNLGECYAQLGKVASAWGAYNDAADLARKNGEGDRAKQATAKADELRARVPHMRVELGANAGLTGVSVARDGKPMDSSLVGVDLPVDPGALALSVTAPGHKAWSTKLTIKEGASEKVEVPTLVAEETVKITPTPDESKTPEQRASPGRGQRVAGLVVGGVGIAVAAVGAVFGFSAMSAWNDAQNACPTGMGCSPEAISTHDDASNKATLSTIFVGVGAAAIVTGVVLYVTAPKSAKNVEHAWRVSPIVGPSWGLAAAATF